MLFAKDNLSFNEERKMLLLMLIQCLLILGLSQLINNGKGQVNIYVGGGGGGIFFVNHPFKPIS